MKNSDRVVTWCLLLVASSFWISLAWVYFTDQPKDSFYVGPALAATGITVFVDALLLLVAVYGALYGVLRKQVTAHQVAIKWPVLVALVVLSIYLEIKMELSLYPFFNKH